MKCQLVQPAHPSSLICIKFDPTGKHFAVGSADALVSLWDCNELVCVRTLSRLVHVSEDINVENLKPKRERLNPLIQFFQVAFGIHSIRWGRGKLMEILNFTCASGFRALSLKTAVLKRRLVKNRPWSDTLMLCICRLDWQIRTLSFSYDGNLLAAGSEDLLIDIADVNTGQLLCCQILHILKFCGCPR